VKVDRIGKKAIQPSICLQLWAIILPAAGDVQNPMVSSWFHAFCLGIGHSFCFVKAKRGPVSRRLLLFWKMIFSTKAILFDMDGVLMDSTPSVERVWRGWAKAHGLDADRVAGQAHGRRSIETIRAVAPELDAETENVVVEQMEINDKEGVTALPGAAELLNQLPAGRFAIVTSATRPLAVARLGYAGIPVPRNMITADDVVHGKPSPEPYLKGAALLGFAAGDCLVFEDTPAGIASARAAGMQTVALQTTYPLDQLQVANAVVCNLADVKAVVREEGITIELAPIQLVKS
jgi:sugar-phosphatase